MTSKARNKGTDAAIEGVAIEWVIREGAGPLADHEQARLDAWLLADSRHEAALRQARATWATLDILALDPGGLRDGLPPVSASHSNRPPLARLTGFLNTAAVSLCVAIAIGAGTLWYGDPVTMFRADFRTGVGETRTVVLEDGSRVELGPESAIATRFSEQERRIELLSGVAAFAAVPKVKAGNRPFVVAAVNGEAQALGTRFMVERLPDAVGVTVTEHRVRVAAARQGPARTATIVSPGQYVRYDEQGVGTPGTADIAFATAWQRGRLIIDAAPLGDAVAQFNRYRRGRIVLAGSALARRKVSGVFDTNDIDGAVATIAAELRLRQARIGPLMTILY